MEVRLNKFLAESLGISRREADDLISGGKILINGKVALLGARVRMSGGDDSIDNNDIVCYNGGIGTCTASCADFGGETNVGRRSSGAWLRLGVWHSSRWAQADFLQGFRAGARLRRAGPEQDD